MSSSIQYNPNPPRVWSRVQNPCSVIAYKNGDSDFARAEYERQMLLKGNILQYKKNSSNLTKKQRYTQIAKGMWTNRTKTWATQSDTYTNPNMTSLLRVNYTILDPSNNTFSSRSNPFGCPTTEIQDGGNLVCNVVVNPCTQEVVKRTKSQQLCNPTSDSDVPGQIQLLCWNDGTQTWYPRQRYTMGNSGTSWPEGYKGFVSAYTFIGPVLSVGNIQCGLSVPLEWTFLDSTCAPITSFNIYQNDVLILNVPVSQTSVTINETTAGTYSFYVTSLSNDIESEKSNSVIVSTQYGYNSENAIISNGDRTITFLQNGSITFFCVNQNISITCVGGGGGGGGGSSSSGGGGGGSGGGGGGGGGEIITTNFVTAAITYSVIVGNGGALGLAGSSSTNGGNGTNGDSSSITGGITTITSIGGKGGTGGQTSNSNGGNGGNSGSGGAGGIGGIGTGGPGGPGGIGINGGGGGGGGYSGGDGGNGSINGVDGYGSGGGGGGGNDFVGGIGGVNAGNGTQPNSNPTSGISNKGGGGGGGSSISGSISQSGGNGGSGVVIINLP